MSDVEPQRTTGHDPDIRPTERTVRDRSREPSIRVRRHPRRQEITELLEALPAKHSQATIYAAWDHASAHQDDEVEAVVRGAVGRLVLLYLPTYSPWLNPIEILGRHYQPEGTHCELFENVKALIAAILNYSTRYNRMA